MSCTRNGLIAAALLLLQACTTLTSPTQEDLVAGRKIFGSTVWLGHVDNPMVTGGVDIKLTFDQNASLVLFEPDMGTVRYLNATPTAQGVQFLTHANGARYRLTLSPDGTLLSGDAVGVGGEAFSHAARFNRMK